jgi:DNA-binding GntR family transcriptional regulator
VPDHSERSEIVEQSEHLYEKVADDLRRQMDDGALNPGDRLPSQEELSVSFGVSRAVARQAIDILEKEGRVDRAKRAGTFVRRYEPLLRRSALHYRHDPGAPFAEESIAANRIPAYSHQSERVEADPDVARRLRIAPGDEVMRTVYISKTNDDPVMTVSSFEPLAITGGTAIERPEGPGPYIAAGLVERFSAIGLTPTVVIERLRCRMPRPSETEALQLRPGTPVVTVVRVTYVDNRPVETADMIFAADRFEFEYPITIRETPS